MNLPQESSSTNVRNLTDATSHAVHSSICYNSDMVRARQRRAEWISQTLGATLFAIGCLCGLATFLSLWWSFGFQGRHAQARIAGNVLWCAFGSNMGPRGLTSSPDSFFFADQHDRWTWWWGGWHAAWHTYPTFGVKWELEMSMPIWILATLLIATGVLVCVIANRIWQSVATEECPRCRYSRDGLSIGSACPECGKGVG